MRIFGDGSILDKKKGEKAIRQSLDLGFNHFDHADIYGSGESEKIFGKCLRDASSLGFQREKLIVTSKCGIRNESGFKTKSLTKESKILKKPKRYDSSKTHIIESVEGSLRRLQTDYLDILLLHRPDYLMDPREVSDAFNHLKEQGKVNFK